MTPLALARLHNQRVIAPRFTTPLDVVHALGAVQAQDFAGSLWGIALRTTSATIADVEAAIASRAIVRTWPMRGTLHFVDARDLRWMTGLLAPRVIARTASRHRDLGLDAKVFAKSRKILEKALEGGRTLARPDAYAVLAKGGVATDGQRGIHILAMLAMQRVVCFGAHHGKQASFALVDEWIAESRELDRDAALGELATRYFTSHGPATLADFAWWSGLPQGEASRGIATAPSLDGKDGMWFVDSSPAKPSGTHVVAYKDRSAVLDSSLVEATRGGIFSPTVLVDGNIIGTWRRERKRDRVVVHADLQLKLRSKRALDAAARRYEAFLGTPVDVVIDP
jgi:hypothetical protein